MRVSVLGATEAWRGEERLLLGSRKRRALVAALALSGGRPVSVDALVDLLWGDAPPDGVAGTLQVYVSGLRRVIEPERAPRAPATVLVTVEPGYALVLPDDGLDAARFDRAVSGAHRLLASPARRDPRGRRGCPAALAAADLRAAVASLDEALGLWRGTPYVELEEAPAAVAERARLEELRTVALEDRAVAALALGDHATVAAELESLTARYPLRERLWGLRALALARAGRQADALEALAAVRTVLDEELGLEPGTDLRSLQTAVLRQDPALAWAPPPGADVVEVAAPVAGGPRRCAPAPVPGVTLPPWPLVGRDRQLLLLIDAWTRAESGVPAFAALTGEPGIGKSRLSAELAGPRRRRAVPGCWSAAARRTAARPRSGRGSRCSSSSASSSRRAARRTRARSSGCVSAWPAGSPTPPRPSRCCWCSRTCTGPTSPACGCCGCWSTPSSPGGCWCSRRGARTPSRRARWPTSPSRWPAGTRSGSS